MKPSRALFWWGFSVRGLGILSWSLMIFFLMDRAARPGGLIFPRGAGLLWLPVIAGPACWIVGCYLHFLANHREKWAPYQRRVEWLKGDSMTRPEAPDAFADNFDCTSYWTSHREHRYKFTVWRLAKAEEGHVYLELVTGDDHHGNDRRCLPSDEFLTHFLPVQKIPKHS